MRKFKVIPNTFKNFYFFVFGSELKKLNLISKKASTKAPSLADKLALKLSYVMIGGQTFLLPKSMFTEKQTSS